MYLNDPFDLTLEPKLEGWDKDEEEDTGPDYGAVFHGEFRHYPSIMGSGRHSAVDVCRFNEQGEHVQIAKNCPHYDMVDEEGPRIRPGWTVQSNRQ